MRRIPPPPGPGHWSLSQIQLALSGPIPNLHVVELEHSGRTSRLINYKTVLLSLERYAPGWSWEVRNRSEIGGALWITGRLTVIASDGAFYRDAIARASPVSDEPVDGMALRMAAAKYGLGLGL